MKQGLTRTTVILIVLGVILFADVVVFFDSEPSKNCRGGRKRRECILLDFHRYFFCNGDQ